MSDDEPTEGQRGSSFLRDLMADEHIIARSVALLTTLLLGAIASWLIIWRWDGERERNALFWSIGLTAIVSIGIIGLALLGGVRRVASRERSQVESQRNAETVARRLVAESRAMLDYALSKGFPVENRHLIAVYTAQATMDQIDADDGRDRAVALLTPQMVTVLGDARSHLVEVVRPATPSTLALLQESQPSALFEPLGRVRLIRHMLYVAIVFLLAALAIIIAADPLAEASAVQTTQQTTVATSENGVMDSVAEPILGDARVDRLWNSVFLVVVAGLGAAFFALYTATRYVKQNSYDEQYEPTYWIRFVLGLVGGFTLALIVGDDFLGENSIGIPLLAFIGGFSADVVQRVLQRVVDTVDALVRGSSDARVEDQMRGLQSHAALDVASARLRLVAPLLALESELSAGLESDEARRRLRAIVGEAMPLGVATPDPGVGRPPDGSDSPDDAVGSDETDR